MRSSIVCGEYHRILKTSIMDSSNISNEIQIEEILSSIIKSTQPYFIISTIIIFSANLLHVALSPLPTTTLMSSTLTIYIVVSYVIHLTFFLPVLTINLRRVSSRRHCLLFRRLPKKTHLRTILKPSIVEQHYNKYQSLFQISSFTRKFIASVLCFVSLIAVIFSIRCVFSIDTRLFFDELLPRDATSIRLHMKSQIEDFSIGPIIMFTIPEPINYSDPSVNASIRSLSQECRNKKRTNHFSLLWLDFESVPHILEHSSELPVVHRITPFSRNDLIVSVDGNHSMITASRFYCQYNSIIGLKK